MINFRKITILVLQNCSINVFQVMNMRNKVAANRYIVYLLQIYICVYTINYMAMYETKESIIATTPVS